MLAGILEQTLIAADPEGGPMHPARLTIDLERPLGLVPIVVTARITRSGRKVRIAEAELSTEDGTRVAHASLLGIRALPEPLDYSVAVVPDDSVNQPELPADPQVLAVATFAAAVEGPMFHSHAVEHRFVTGHMGVLGPGSDWIRLRVPVLAGEATSPLQRVAAAADFGNGVSGSLPHPWMFINPDLTVTLYRLPVGEWVCLDSVSRFGPAGVGSAESELWDEQGRLGRSIQNLLVEPPR